MLAWFIGVSLFLVGLNVATIVLVLALLGGKEDRFVTWRQMHKLIDRMTKVEKGNAALYRYLEGLDDRTGGTGHLVLIQGMPGDHTSSGD